MNPLIANMLASIRKADIKVQACAPVVRDYQPDYALLKKVSAQIAALEAAGYTVVDMDINSQTPQFVVRVTPEQTDLGGLYIYKESAL